MSQHVDIYFLLNLTKVYNWTHMEQKHCVHSEKLRNIIICHCEGKKGLTIAA